MKGSSQQTFEMPHKAKLATQKGMYRSGTAMRDYCHENSLQQFMVANQDDSMPLRRRQVPLPPSSNLHSYQVTTSSSNQLLGHGAGSALQMNSSTSSLQQASKKKKSQLKRSINKSVTGTTNCPSSTSRSGLKSSQSYSKENSSHYQNAVAADQRRKHGSSSHRNNEHLPAGPQSQHPPKSNLPKSQRGKNLKQISKKDKGSQERKLHALQLQFMHDTLTKLQIEKQNRAQAINRTLLRKSSSKPLAQKDSSVTDLYRSSKNGLSESRFSLGSQRSRSGRSRSRNASSAESQSWNNKQQQQQRTNPRLCELRMLTESQATTSEITLPQQFKQVRKSFRSQERALSSKSSTKKRARSNSSRNSSTGKKARQSKLKKQPSSKFSKNDDFEIKESMKRRQAKIMAMEQEFMQKQRQQQEQLDSDRAPGTHMLMNEMSAISMQSAVPPHFYPEQQQPDQQLYAHQLSQQQHHQNEPDIAITPNEMFEIHNEKIVSADEVEDGEDDCEDDGGESSEGEQDGVEGHALTAHHGVSYAPNDSQLEEGYLQQVVEGNHNCQPFLQKQQQYVDQRPPLPVVYPPLQQHPLQPQHPQSLRAVSSHQQLLTHLQSATDEKVPQPSSHLMSQVTIPQVGSLQHINCLDFQSSGQEVHQTPGMMQHVTSLGRLSTDGNGFPMPHHMQSVKMSTTNKDDRKPDIDKFDLPRQSVPTRQSDQKPQQQEEQSSTGRESKAKEQNQIISFFEQEYRNIQKELLAAKSELYEQKFKTDVLKKRVGEYEQVVETMSGDIIKLQEENKELRSMLNSEPVAMVVTQPNTQQFTHRSGSYQMMNSQRTTSGIQSDINAIQEEETDESMRIREENELLQQQNNQLMQKMDGMQSAQKSQDVLIQYLQGTQNSILQKMQHQMIKNQFATNLVETAQLAQSFIYSGDKTNVNSHQESIQQMTNHPQQVSKAAYNTAVQQPAPSSLDLQQFIGLRKEDIGNQIEDYFKKSNEAAGLSDEKQEAEVLQNMETQKTAVEEGIQSVPTEKQSEMAAEQQIRQENYFGSGLILPAGASGGHYQQQQYDQQALTKGIQHPQSGYNSRKQDPLSLNEQSQMSHGVGGPGAHHHEESSILHDYDSKTFSENQHQHDLQQRLNGISPVTQLRKIDSRRSLSYQKSSQNQTQHQQSSNKGGANNDVSVISLSHVNSNSKYMVPKQMRQLLAKHGSEDGEMDDYLQTGAFEKRSNEMRLFSLDGTAQQDIQNMIELSQSCEDVQVDGKIQSPVKDFTDQSGVLNLVHHMQHPFHRVNNQVCSPEILNQMRQNIVFSGEMNTKEDERGTESQLSSPEMDCTQTDSKGTTTQGAATLMTKDQREIQEIIATTKQFTCAATSNLVTRESDYHTQPSAMTAALPKQSLKIGGSGELRVEKTHSQPPVKSPQFNQNNNHCLNLPIPILSKETSPKVLKNGNASQEMYSKTQNSIKNMAASARPHSTCKVSDMVMIKNDASDDQSITTVSASFLHNIKKSNILHHRRDPSMTSHDTVPADYFLQREHTHGSNMSGLQHQMATGTLSHMPTEQYMPRLTNSFANQHTNPQNHSAHHSSYSPFKTHQPGTYPSGRAQQNLSRSISPNPNTCSSAHGQSALACSSDRIQKRTKKMKQEIQDIDRDIAMLHNVISR